MDTILLFTDLDGTIFNDTTGKIEKEDLDAFFSALVNLQNVSNSMVHIYITSFLPEFQSMETINFFDEQIDKYNSSHSSNLSEIKGALGLIDPNFISHSKTDPRILLFEQQENSLSPTRIDYKNRFIQSIYNEVQSTRNQKIKKVIYCGNDSTDINCFDTVKRLPNSFTIAPSNLTRKVPTNLVTYIGSQPDVLGVIEGLNCLSKQIKKEEDSKSQQQH